MTNMFFTFRNQVAFTPTQIEAVRAGMQPGLTMVIFYKYVESTFQDHRGAVIRTVHCKPPAYRFESGSYRWFVRYASLGCGFSAI